MAVWSSVSINRIGEAARIDSEFFRPEHMIREQLIHSHGGQQLGSIADISNGATPSEYTEDGAIAFVRSGDLTSPLIDAASSTGFLRAAPLKKMKRLQRGDVLISSIGVGSIGKISLVVDPAGLATVAEVTVARSKGTSPEYLFAYLSTPAGRGEIERRVTGATGQQHLIKREAERVLVPTSVDDKLLDELSSTVQQAIEQRRQAADLIAAAEARLMGALGLDGEGGSEGGLDLTPSKTYTRSFADLRDEARFDAEYFNPRYQTLIDHLRTGGQTLADVCTLRQEKFVSAPDTVTFDRDGRPTSSGRFNYIQIGSLTGDGEADADTLPVADAPSRATWIVKPGDVITSLVRPIRRLSALIHERQADFVCSSGFAVLRPHPPHPPHEPDDTGHSGIEPEVLLTYLRLPLICELLDLNTTASMYPAIPTDRLMRIPIALPDPATRAEIVEHVRASMQARRTAATLLAQAKHRVEALIEEHS